MRDAPLAGVISPGLADALNRWLAELVAVRGRTAATVESYRADVMAFLAFLQGHEGAALGTTAMSGIDSGTMRAWACLTVLPASSAYARFAASGPRLS